MSIEKTIVVLKLVSGLAVLFVGCGRENSQDKNQAVTGEGLVVSPLPKADIVFVTGVLPSSPAYHFSELVLTEAFDRLGLSFSLQNHPSSRAMEMVTQGIADGDSCRIEYLLDLGDFPNHVRVDEPILLHFSYAYVIDEDIEIQGWDSLKNTNYRVGYARGVRYVEKALTNVVSDDYIFIVTDATTGFEMLESDRIDVLVAGLTPLPSKYEDGSIRRAGVLQESRIYSYMNKKHSELAKQLSETLRTMKSQGLFQEYERQLGVTIAAE